MGQRWRREVVRDDRRVIGWHFHKDRVMRMLLFGDLWRKLRWRRCRALVFGRTVRRRARGVRGVRRVDGAVGDHFSERVRPVGGWSRAEQGHHFERDSRPPFTSATTPSSSTSRDAKVAVDGERRRTNQHRPTDQQQQLLSGDRSTTLFSIQG